MTYSRLASLDLCPVCKKQHDDANEMRECFACGELYPATSKR